MKTYTRAELAEILESHAKWLRGEEGGVCANLRNSDLRNSDLSGSDLSCSDLSYSDLRNSDLRNSDLSYSDLSGSDLRNSDLRGAAHAWAQVAFMGHGECGRMLTAVILKEGEEARYWCGCFSGSLDDLKKYIEDGEERHKASRTRCMEVVNELLNIKRA